MYINRIKHIHNHLRNISYLNSHISNAENKIIHHNLDYKTIQNMYSKQYNNNISHLNTENGIVQNIDTGIFTGRSPNDKYFVDSTNEIWCPPNKLINPLLFNKLYNKCLNHFDKLDTLYIFDGYCGHGSSRINVRFITEYLWQHHFVKNMFIEKTDNSDFEPDFTILNACNVTNKDFKQDNLNSEVFVVLNLDKSIGIIGGTHYGGEMKKGIFSIMNYLLPKKEVLPMHCSANIGKHGDVALFFGLSGTGKTTLSATNDRLLIGDDEHGWDDNGIFNFEGGCYAKTIDLSKEKEPEIYNAIKPNALLENISYDVNFHPNYHNSEKTQNGRVSYGLDNLSTYYTPQVAGHPKTIIFLTCDAFGVLPPVSKLTNDQAIYHFLTGYTAKIAGTERGVKEPTATFSSCFGEAFLSLHPNVYADLLKEKLNIHKPNVWLVNTGWTGGKYGVGERIPLEISRKCIDAILNNNMTNFTKYTYFDLMIPTKIDGINSDMLNPELMWEDKLEFLSTVNHLNNLFNNQNN